MIYLGDKNIGTVYLGDKKLSKIYLGDKLVWEGYPEGHIIGLSNVANRDLSADRFYDSKGNTQTLTCTTDANKKYDLDLSSYGYGDTSRIFYYDSQWVTIDSFKVTMYVSAINYEVLFCDNLTNVNLNGIKIVPTNTAYNTISIITSFRNCNNLKYIQAKGIEWDKIREISGSFTELPSLIRLDLSGANFDNINISDSSNFSDLGSVGTIVKVVGCSETTQNKILNALNTNNSGQTWVLKDGVITRTK